MVRTPCPRCSRASASRPNDERVKRQRDRLVQSEAVRCTPDRRLAAASLPMPNMVLVGPRNVGRLHWPPATTTMRCNTAEMHDEYGNHRATQRTRAHAHERTHAHPPAHRSYTPTHLPTSGDELTFTCPSPLPRPLKSWANVWKIDHQCRHFLHQCRHW